MPLRVHKVLKDGLDTGNDYKKFELVYGSIGVDLVPYRLNYTASIGLVQSFAPSGPFWSMQPYTNTQFSLTTASHLLSDTLQYFDALSI